MLQSIRWLRFLLSSLQLVSERLCFNNRCTNSPRRRRLRVAGPTQGRFQLLNLSSILPNRTR